MRTEFAHRQRFLGLGLSLAMGALLLLILSSVVAGTGLAAHQGAAAAPQLVCSTVINSNVTVPTTWTVAGSPYCVQADIEVSTGVTLTVKPGVIVAGGDDREVKVKGHLEAVGTPAQPITFTSVTDTGWNQWAGLIFDGGTGHLGHATVRYAGDCGSLGCDRAAILARNVSSGRVLLESSQVVNNALGLRVLDSRVAVSDTLFSGHNEAGMFPPLRIEGASSVVTLTANTFTNNVRNRVVLVAGAMTNHGFALQRQNGLDGYELDTDFTVPAGNTLTVEPGVTVMADRNEELKVQGHLEAVGTIAQPITFTSSYNRFGGVWYPRDNDRAFRAGHVGSSAPPCCTVR